MTKEQLLQLAEAGVRERLRAMQEELNELARTFPHIVRNQDTTIPSVMPIQLKPSSNGHPKMSVAARLDAIRQFLATHPGATTREIGVAVGLSPGHAQKLASQVAQSRQAGPHNKFAWELKTTAIVSPAKSKKFSKQMKSYWARMTPKERKARVATMLAARRRTQSHHVRNAAAEAS